MRYLGKLLTSLLISGAIPAFAGMAPEALSLSQLEKRINEIDTELEQLASYSLRSGVGAVGYDSKSYDQPNNTEWIRIDLDREVPVEQIILVPSIWRDPETGLRAEGFPRSFRVLAGTPDTTNIVATYTSADQLLPRIAPLVIQCKTPVDASWIQIEATELSPQGWTEKYTLQFSEIMVFSGGENVAINQNVSVSNLPKKAKEGRQPSFLVDGFVPYLMDAARGESSKALIRRLKRRFVNHTITIDLEQSAPISQINLHAVDLSHNIPEAAPNGYAMPRKLKVTGAQHPDFSDETILFEYNEKTTYDIGPILIRRFPEIPCRYVRITILKLQPNTAFQPEEFSLGFSEIEVLSKGQNVALNKHANSSTFSPSYLQKMLDGHNFFGEILPIRDWMNQLARRHDLETERPLISEELNRRYARQKTALHRLSWLVALLIIGFGFFRILQMRTVAAIRERFAADLHDELGANIHTIGLLGDAALNAIDSPEDMKEILQRNRELTERTGTAIRRCMNLQEAGGLFTNLPDDMRKTAHRILSDFDYEIIIEGEEFLTKLKPRTCSDLFLFYKEALVNISRHAEATRFSTRLTAAKKEILLTITDNGLGLSEGIPPSLKRRAHLLGGKVSTGQTDTGETKITLRLRRHRLRLKGNS